MPHCRTDGQGLTCGRGLPPPAGQRVGLPPRHRAAGTCRPAAAASLQGQNAIKNKFYLHQGQEGGRGPAAPQPGGRGINL